MALLPTLTRKLGRFENKSNFSKRSLSFDEIIEFRARSTLRLMFNNYFLTLNIEKTTNSQRAFCSLFPGKFFKKFDRRVCSFIELFGGPFCTMTPKFRPVGNIYKRENSWRQTWYTRRTYVNK